MTEDPIHLLAPESFKLDTLAMFDEQDIEIDLEVAYSGQGTQLITFLLGEERYGVEIVKIRELISFPESITPIPGMPGYVAGMINLRGLVIPVVDLRLRFGMPAGEYHRFTVVIVVQIAQKCIGISVDSVSDVIFLEDENLQEIPEDSTNIDTEFLKGVVCVREEMVILLDVERLFSSEELLRIAQYASTLAEGS